MKLYPLVLAALFGFTCAHVPPVPEVKPCVVQAPPKLAPVKLAGPEAGCPDAFAACLALSDALALEENLRAMQAWQAETWNRCGVLPKQP